MLETDPFMLPEPDLSPLSTGSFPPPASVADGLGNLLPLPPGCGPQEGLPQGGRSQDNMLVPTPTVSLCTQWPV